MLANVRYIKIAIHVLRAVLGYIVKKNSLRTVITSNSHVRLLNARKRVGEIGNLGYKIKNQRREINERLKQIEKLKEKEQECERYKQAIEEILELADDNKHTIQYKGICQSILEIINNAKDINVPSKKDGE